MSSLSILAATAGEAIRFEDLGLSPIIFEYGWFKLRWYSLAYLAGILAAYWYVLKLIAEPGAPMARRHVDDLAFYGTFGVIIGGRVAYVLFYDPAILQDPLGFFKLWNGGMSFHGGVAGVTMAILFVAWRNKLEWLRVHDYVACGVPFGLFFGRVANFINGELWGSPTNVPWAVIFPNGGEVPRHPSQLYEAGLEGIFLFILLWFLFWKTQARYQPGKLVGAFLLGYGVSRFLVEFVRQPDEQLTEFAQQSGLHMGQWLSIPMILGGVYLIATASARRRRVEPIAGADSIA